MFLTWNQDHPQSLLVSAECDSENCAPLPGTRYAIFTWNDETGAFTDESDSFRGTITSFKEYVNREWDLEPPWDEMDCLAFISRSEVDRDSGFAFALLNLESLEEGDFVEQGTIHP